MLLKILFYKILLLCIAKKNANGFSIQAVKNEVLEIVGHPVELECYGQTPPGTIFSWTKEGVTLGTGRTDVKIYVLPIPSSENLEFLTTLDIERIKNSDYGTYKCEISHSEGTLQAMINLSPPPPLHVHTWIRNDPRGSIPRNSAPQPNNPLHQPPILWSPTELSRENVRSPNSRNPTEPSRRNIRSTYIRNPPDSSTANMGSLNRGSIPRDPAELSRQNIRPSNSGNPTELLRANMVPLNQSAISSNPAKPARGYVGPLNPRNNSDTGIVRPPNPRTSTELSRGYVDPLVRDASDTGNMRPINPRTFTELSRGYVGPLVRDASDTGNMRPTNPRTSTELSRAYVGPPNPRNTSDTGNMRALNPRTSTELSRESATGSDSSQGHNAGKSAEQPRVYKWTRDQGSIPKRFVARKNTWHRSKNSSSSDSTELPMQRGNTMAQNPGCSQGDDIQNSKS